MAKTDYEHHLPRIIDKSKRQRGAFDEAVLDKRKNKISFKNYVRQLEEDELAEELSGEGWIVEEGVTYQDDTHWAEVAGPFTNEDDAVAMQEDFERVAEDATSYRITKVGD
jgi:RNA-splicing ligase RtcB